MKKIIIMTVMLLAFTAAFAQEDEGKEETTQSSYHQNTLFGSGQTDFGGFGGVIAQGTIMNGKVYYMAGAEGALLIDHQFFIGFSGKGLATPVMTSGTTGLYLGWGGLMLGYIFMPDQVLHPYIKTTIGAGGVSEINNPYNYYHDTNNMKEKVFMNAAPFFAIEGEAGLEVNVTRWMKVVAFGGYHYLYGPFEFGGIKDSDLGGIDFGVKAEFGFF